jgi:acyl-CoA reductase-like NAD-dependent aldehyde dehydrogenase
MWPPLLEQRKGEAAHIIAQEPAKPVRAALEEINRTIQTCKFSSEEAKRIHGKTLC